MSATEIISEVTHMRRRLERERVSGRAVGVVPTMGALHDGHLSLVRKAKETCDLVVVTIFVNPTQFGPSEDFDRYPRSLERDSDRAWGAGAQLIFAPSVAQMYPIGEQTRVQVSGVSEGLCGAHRPGHFEGVATVVAKFFSVLGVATYFFGQKDYQQLAVIERMAVDLLFPVNIVGCPIVREADGLAMSSRNVYLTESERKVAPALFASLLVAQAAYNKGERRQDSLLDLARERIQGGAREEAEFVLEYLELRDAKHLGDSILDGEGNIHPPDRQVVLLVAARLGETRLIDNLVL